MSASRNRIAPKSALVTGSSGSIGRAICELLLEGGWKVLGLDVAPTPKGVKYGNVNFDLSRLDDPTARKHLVGQVKDFCGGRLDGLVNNAALQIVKPVGELDYADWQRTLSVNLLAPFFLTQALAGMLRRAGGAVVNVTSIHARLTKPGFAAYAASKGALVTLTRSLALELAPRIRVNAVLPAATDTPMLRAGFKGNAAGFKQLGSFHPLGRIAKPREVAQAVEWLLSPGSSFVTGATLNIDGGIGCRLHDPEL